MGFCFFIHGISWGFLFTFVLCLVEESKLKFFSLFVKVYFGCFFLFIYVFLYSILQTELYFPGRRELEEVEGEAFRVP